MSSMAPTPPALPGRRRLALLPVETPRAQDRPGPAVRRYRLGRVIDDLGDAFAAAPREIRAPAVGGRAP